MKKTLIILAAVGLLTISGFFGMNYIATYMAEEKLDSLVEEINSKNNPDNKLSYADVSATEFGSSVLVRDVRFENSKDNSDLQIASVDLGGLSSDSEFAQSIFAQNIRLQFTEVGKSHSIKIDTLTIEGLPKNRNSEFPEHLLFQFEGMEVTLPKQKALASTGNGPLDMALHFMPDGKESLKINAKITLYYDTDKKSLASKANFGFEKLFAMDMNIKLHGFEFRKDLFNAIERNSGATVKPGLEQLLVNANKVALGNVQIQFHNDGLVDVAMAVAIKETGTDAIQIKQGILAQLEKLGETFGRDSPVILEALVELRKFVENPKSLTLSATPDEPFRFSESAALGNPQMLAKHLNIKVLAN